MRVSIPSEEYLVSASIQIDLVPINEPPHILRWNRIGHVIIVSIRNIRVDADNVPLWVNVPLSNWATLVPKSSRSSSLPNPGYLASLKSDKNSSQFFYIYALEFTTKDLSLLDICECCVYLYTSKFRFSIGMRLGYLVSWIMLTLVDWVFFPAWLVPRICFILQFGFLVLRGTGESLQPTNSCAWRLLIH